MGYDIERHKRVLSLKTTDKRFACRGGETLIFLWASACNNVTPRTFDWDVIAVHDHSVWHGEVQLPKRIWEMGYWADGGAIKPNDRDVAGLTYVRQWKDAVAKRYALLDSADRALWYPRITIWVGDYGTGDQVAAELQAKGVDAFGKRYKHRAQEVHDTFRRLHPEPLKGGSRTLFISERAQLLDALHLFNCREDLPFSYYLTARQDESFLLEPPAERPPPETVVRRRRGKSPARTA